MKWITLYKTCEEKCFASGKNIFPFLPLRSRHHCLNRRLPWRHRGPFPYWLPGWSQSDEESRDQMLLGLILLSPVSSVSTFTFVMSLHPHHGSFSGLSGVDHPATATHCYIHWFEYIVNLNICNSGNLYITECRIQKKTKNKKNSGGFDTHWLRHRLK